MFGNRRARRVLIEGAWTYRYPARVSETLQTRIEQLSKAVRDIAWRAQVRLCAPYRRLIAAGKKAPVAIAAIAREMAAFLWAIGQEVHPLTLRRRAFIQLHSAGMGPRKGTPGLDYVAELRSTPASRCRVSPARHQLSPRSSAAMADVVDVLRKSKRG